MADGSTSYSTPVTERSAKVDGTQWEYSICDAINLHVSELNAMGREGWEMCGATKESRGCTIFFKRRIGS